MSMLRVISVVVLGSMLARAGVARADERRPPPPCTDVASSEFDFWLGEWEAYDSNDGSLQGLEHVTRDLDGCVLRQNWHQQSNRYKHPGSDHRLHGTSVTGRVANAPAGAWWQTWTDNVGSFIVLVGGLKDGVMVLTGVAGNSPYLRKWHWQPLDDGSVRSWGTASTDGGSTWQTTWDITYRRPEAAKRTDATPSPGTEMQ